MVKRVELGCSGHFIAVSKCHFRRHTQVGNHRISTVGDYFPDGAEGERNTVGLDRFFETMVFETLDKPDKGSEGCGCMEVASLTGVDFESYNTAGEAHAGHERMVRKYMRKTREALKKNG